MSEAVRAALAAVVDGATLTMDEARLAMGSVMDGDATPAQLAALLVALRMRGETIDELTGFAAAMRERVTKVDAPHDVVDTCGTGGDGQHTLNISTAAALVAAGGGLKVAKHGNRALSSRSGSSDVLAALGVNLDATPEQSKRALDEAGVCFLFAPAYHRAMRHVLPVRQELGFRTIFNLLGPVSNPAGAKRQVLGVYDPRLLEPLARVLGNLGAQRAWVVHGSDGLDEVTLSGKTAVAEVDGGSVRVFVVGPEDFGLRRVELAELRGGDAEANARIIRGVLSGERGGAARSLVVANAAAALLVGGRADNLREAARLADESIESGGALSKLEELARATNE
jgi:anthranilate phosphoribosyltransferase